MKDFFKRLYVIPFQTGLGLYIIINGIMSSHHASEIFIELIQFMGGYAQFIIGAQIFSGISILFGSGFDKKIFESIGLLLAATLFVFKSFIFLGGGDISLTVVNSLFISGIITLACITRFSMIFYIKYKGINIWIKK